MLNVKLSVLSMSMYSMYEARPCLWDIADRSYSKRDINEKALSEIKEKLGIEIAVIKAKWNSLRAQHGRELTKENKTKSGQSADEVYESSWPFMVKMRFVEQIKKTAKSTSTLKLSDSIDVDKDSDKESDRQDDPLILDSNVPSREKSCKRRRGNPNEEKQKLIAKCIDVLDKTSPSPMLIADPFAMYVSEQLKGFDKRRRLIAEKRINHVLFDLRFEPIQTQSAPRYEDPANSQDHFLQCSKNFKHLYLYCLYFVTQFVTQICIKYNKVTNI